MSLKLLLLEKLKKGKMTRDELRNYGRSIKTENRPYGWDMAGTDRALRHLTAEKKIKPIKIQRYNVAYRVLEPFVAPHKPHSKPLDEKTENTLDERLISLLTQDINVNTIREINRAIKSKELFIKRSALEKYE